MPNDISKIFLEIKGQAAGLRLKTIAVMTELISVYLFSLQTATFFHGFRDIAVKTDNNIRGWSK